MGSIKRNCFNANACRKTKDVKRNRYEKTIIIGNRTKSKMNS